MCAHQTNKPMQEVNAIVCIRMSLFSRTLLAASITIDYWPPL